MSSFLDKERIVAGDGYNRWLIPPAALAIHLSIGEVYAFSVFNLPLTKLIGIDQSAAGDWKLTSVVWIFSLAIFTLGLAAWLLGRWLERVGPRKAMALAALCFGGGFVVSAFGVWAHSLVLTFLGYGVIGGIGLGLGYISPVSTLMKWFPDRPGMSTGLAIMGFGGGAMIGSPLSVALMQHFRTASSLGVGKTFVALGIFYFLLMMFGALIVRIPRPGWKPEGYRPPRENPMITSADVLANEAVKTPQFWLIWAVLFLNVTAGIAVLSQASPMIQEVVGVTAAAAAGFVGLLSVFNMLGRFFWSTVSDYVGRKNTYHTFFLLGAVVYALVPSAGKMGSTVLFVAGYLIIISMYGGGFATAPAYLKDMFGMIEVGAIHGRLLTAWSAAGVAGPILITYLRESQIDSGVPKSQAYTITMYVMVGLLLVGFLCNYLVKPVHSRHHYAGGESADGETSLEAATL